MSDRSLMLLELPGFWIGVISKWGAHVDLALASGDPAVLTAIWPLLLRSGSAHCDLAVAVEVRSSPLRSGPCCRGPAVPVYIL